MGRNYYDSGPTGDYSDYADSDAPYNMKSFGSEGGASAGDSVSGMGSGVSSGGFGAIGAVVGGMIGNEMSAGDRDQSAIMAQKALQELLNIGYPPETAKALVLQQYQQAGILTPELEKSIEAGPSALAAISEDPELKDRQMSALNLISQRATGGLSPEDRAKFNEIRTQIASDQNAKQQQIIQQAQMRGMGRSGAELAAALSEQQAGANRASAEGDRLAATASQNALQAALQSGQLGGQMRQQDFNVASTRANAEDQMKRFNVQNQTGQQQRNVGAQNQAQQYNLTNKQNVGNANTGMYNQEQQRQNQAKMSDWNAKRGYAKDLGTAYGGESERYGKKAQATTDMWGGIGGAIGSGIGMAMANGGMVPGEAKFPGNHPDNDTVDAKLSPGEIVIPRHIAQSEDAPIHAANYISLIKKAQEHGKKKS